MFPRFVATLLLAGTPLLQNADSRMDQVVQSYVSNKQFMGSVLVARGDQILLSKGYGSANLEWQIPNTPSTKFRLGSVTKQFTAASILLLEERGKLKVEDPVKRYLPDAPAAWDGITIFHVLTHTAGIPNFTSFPEYAKLEPFAITPEQLVAVFKDKPLDFAPGEKMSHSNSGYVLLGYLIEKVSGESYQKFLQENIFTPLGMKDSGYDSNTALIAHRAAGYTAGPNGLANTGFIHMSVPFSAGALYSTTEDLLKWEQGLFGGKVISAASLAKMTTPFKSNYAFGLQVETVSGRKMISHGGGIEGFNTFLAYFPDDRLTVIALGNVNGNPPQEIATKLAAVMHGEKVELPSERKEITLAPSVLAAYVGTYQMANGMLAYVRLEGDHLTGQLSGQGRLPLFAESETAFFAKAVDATAEFTRNGQGAVAGFVLHQGGRDLTAERKSGEVAERKEITVPAEALAKYVGQYEMRPGFNMTIKQEANGLTTQMPNQPAFPIFAESEDHFFLKIVDAQLEFQKDASGKVNAVVLKQGALNQRAPKVQ